MKTDQKDIILNLLNTISEQNKIIDKLSDKVLARNLDEYRAGDMDPVPPEDRMKDSGDQHFMDVPGTEILKAIHEPTD